MCAETNPPLLLYVQKKILKRLTILAMYCPKGQKLDDPTNLLTEPVASSRTSQVTSAHVGLPANFNVEL